jgi:hypothetical protein
MHRSRLLPIISIQIPKLATGQRGDNNVEKDEEDEKDKDKKTKTKKKTLP